MQYTKLELSNEVTNAIYNKMCINIIFKVVKKNWHASFTRTPVNIGKLELFQSVITLVWRKENGNFVIRRIFLNLIVSKLSAMYVHAK